MSHSRWKRRALSPKLALFLTIAGMGCGVLPIFLMGALAVQIRDSLGFGFGKLGIAASLFFLASAIASPFAGRMVERAGFRPGLKAAVLASAVSMAGIGLIAESWGSLVFFLAIGGCANATSQVSTTMLVTRSVPPDKQGMAFGLRQAATPAAAMLGGVAVPSLALTVGWEWAFVGGALLATSVVFLIPQVPEQRLARGAPQPRWDSRTGALLLLAATIGFGSATINALQAFFAESSVHHGMHPGLVGVTMASASIVGLLLRIVAGWIADRHQRGRILAVVAMLAAGAGGCLVLATGSEPWIPLGAFLCFGAGWGWSGLFSLAVVSHNPSAPAAATGVTQAGGYIGGAVWPSVFGILVATGSFTLAWTATAFISILGCLAGLAARKRIKSDAAVRDAMAATLGD